MSSTRLLAGIESTSIGAVNLFAGDGHIRTKPGTFAEDLELAEYTVIARNTTSGELVQWAPAGSTGTNIAVGITCLAVDSTSGDVVHPYYISGDFNIDALVWPEGATAAQKEAAFDRTPITVRTLAG